jgi:predicted nucleotidyltransferase
MSDGSPHIEVAETIVDVVTGAIRATTGPALVGLYLCGSLTTGDFDERISDIDLVAVLSSDMSPSLAADLQRMHDALAEHHPTWRGRIEVVYVSTEGLANFRVKPTRVHITSTSEALEVLSVGTDWVRIWYPVHHFGRALVGPPAREMFPVTSFEEYAGAVRVYIRRFTERIPDDATPGSQAYAVLTMCRGLYICVQGEPASKLKAAAWAQKELPEWAGLIRDAITWREHQWEVPQADGTATVATVRRFIERIAERVAPSKD